MYFLWKDTPYGIIRVSHGGLQEFVEETVKSRLRLYSITLQTSDRKDDADMSIVLSEENIIPETKQKVEQHFTAVFEPMGINASVVWTVPDKSIARFLCSPWTWTGIGACIAGFVNAGSAGFFWTAFWAAAGWFSVHGLNELAQYFRRP